MAGKSATVRTWVDERLGLAPVRGFLAHKSVPRHRHAAVYYLGGMTLFFFVVQVATGILLMLYYQPSADHAYESVERLMTEVQFGWLMRSLHSWSANLMVFFAFLHLATTYFTKAYRRPREMTWVTGTLCLFLTLGFGFSGYLLPWNELAYFATKVGTAIAGALPLVGDFSVRFLRGGDDVGPQTLSRFYGWHVAILPALMTVVLGVHLVLVQLHGMSVPPGAEEEARRNRPMRFVPSYMLRELFGWTLALAILAACAALFPWELGEKADPFAPAPGDIRPEWYFMFLFETLKLVPGGMVLGIEYEALPVLASLLAAVALVLVPFLDRSAARGGRSPGFTAVGAAAVVFVVGMTAYGYRSWAPVWIALASGLALLAFERVTWRQREPGAAR